MYYINKYNNRYKVKKNFFKKFFFYNIFTFNFLNKKLFLNLKYKDSLLANMSPGIITKKLDLKSKKSKKNIKIFNIMIKSFIKTFKNNENSFKLIIQIKGTKFNFFKLIPFFNLFLAMEQGLMGFIYHKRRAVLGISNPYIETFSKPSKSS